MKICSEKQRIYDDEKAIPGRVYQMVSGDPSHVGDLYLCGYCPPRLYNMRTGFGRSESGFGRSESGFGELGPKAYRDVTDYVCLDTSRLPPLED
jgi:hypothetical protein